MDQRSNIHEKIGQVQEPRQTVLQFRHMYHRFFSMATSGSK